MSQTEFLFSSVLIWRITLTQSGTMNCDQARNK
jgi:hypothetical protein